MAHTLQIATTVFNPSATFADMEKHNEGKISHMHTYQSYQMLIEYRGSFERRRRHGLQWGQPRDSEWLGHSVEGDRGSLQYTDKRDQKVACLYRAFQEVHHRDVGADGDDYHSPNTAFTAFAFFAPFGTFDHTHLKPQLEYVWRIICEACTGYVDGFAIVPKEVKIKVVKSKGSTCYQLPNRSPAFQASPNSHLATSKMPPSAQTVSRL